MLDVPVQEERALGTQLSRVVPKNPLLQKKTRVGEVDAGICAEAVSLNEAFCCFWFSPPVTQPGASCVFGDLCMFLRFLVLVRSKAGV